MVAKTGIFKSLSVIMLMVFVACSNSGEIEKETTIIVHEKVEHGQFLEDAGAKNVHTSPLIEVGDLMEVEKNIDDSFKATVITLESVIDFDAPPPTNEYPPQDGDENHYSPKDVHDVAKALPSTIGDPKIVGGEDVLSPSAFPWHASLKVKRNGIEVGTICGASILGPSLLITANHCMYRQDGSGEWREVHKTESKTLEVHYGGNELAGRKVAQIKQIIPHPFHTIAKSGDYDSALIILESPLQFNSENVKPIQLPTHTTVVRPYAKLPVIGFGKTSTDPAKPYYLQVADIPYIPRVDCNTPQYYNMQVPHSQFCAGSYTASPDTCRGDSGGGYVGTSSSGINFLFGITSWGEGACEKDGNPGVYTDVRYLTSWILDIASQNELRVGL